MTPTQIVTRKDVYRRVRNLPDNKLPQVVTFIDSLEEYEPNEETVAVLRNIEAGRNLLGPYKDLNDMFQDFGLDVDAKPN